MCKRVEWVGGCTGLAPRNDESFLFRRYSSEGGTRSILSTLCGRGSCQGIVAPAIRCVSIFSSNSSNVSSSVVCGLSSSTKHAAILHPSGAVPVTHLITAHLSTSSFPIHLCCGRGIFIHGGTLTNEASRVPRDNVRLVNSNSFGTSVRILAVTTRTLGESRLGSFSFRVNRTNFFGTILSGVGVASTRHSRVYHLARNGGCTTLNSLLGALSSATRAHILHELPHLFKATRILRRTGGLCDAPRSSGTLRCVGAICSGLYTLNLNSGLVVSLKLMGHSGCCANIIFENCTRNSNMAILSNNECSGLLNRFKLPTPTVNFTISIGTLYSIVGRIVGIREPVEVTLAGNELRGSSITLFRGVKLSAGRLRGGNEQLVLPINSCRTILSGTPSIVACIRRNIYSVNVINGSAVIRRKDTFCRILSLGVNGYGFTLTYPGNSSFFSNRGEGAITAGCPGITNRCLHSVNVSISVVGVRNDIRLTPLLNLTSKVISVIRANSALGRGKLRIIHRVFPVSTEMVMGVTSVGLHGGRVRRFLSRLRRTDGTWTREWGGVGVAGTGNGSRCTLVRGLGGHDNRASRGVISVMDDVVRNIGRNNSRTIHRCATEFSNSIPGGAIVAGRRLTTCTSVISSSFGGTIVSTRGGVFSFRGHRTRRD